MNCKPGDLAVIVRDEYGRFEGCYLRVIADSGRRPCGPEYVFWFFEPLSPSLAAFLQRTKPNNTINDSFIRPIRPGDGEDEMLRIVGKPQEVAA